MSKSKKDKPSLSKKAARAAAKRKSKNKHFIFYLILGVVLLLIIIFLISKYNDKYSIEKLNYGAQIEVVNDPDYGAGHTEDPVAYTMKIPTSGMHNPHDLKFGFYDEKPTYEHLVHNLEHGDIIIYYRPDASTELLDEMKYFAKFTKAGSGVLTVPNEDIPDGKELVVNAWKETMELTAFDEKKIGTFIYKYINQGPEKIPPQIRLGGGTM